jgi:hypothetical protein
MDGEGGTLKIQGYWDCNWSSIRNSGIGRRKVVEVAKENSWIFY